MVKAISVKDVDQHEMVKRIAHFLKKSGKVKVPDWSDLVKMGSCKELAPIDIDWYYTRTASIARRLYIRSPTGYFLFTSSAFLPKIRNNGNQYEALHKLLINLPM